MSRLAFHILKRQFSCSRSLCSPQALAQASPPAPVRATQTQLEGEEDWQQALQRKRRTNWKRKQGGEAFLDHVIINVRAGRGGDGCVAFHREKFQEYGPPAGGNGGRGGDVYILPTSHLTTLSSVPKRVRGNPGGKGHGTWLNGRNGEDVVIKVPVGTVVRELTGDDPRRTKDEWEAEEESMDGLTLDERRLKRRELRFVHYPRYAEENVKRDAFKEAEKIVYRDEREMRIARRERALSPLQFDLDASEEVIPDPNAPLGIRSRGPVGHLVATGGKGGMGNPHFLAPHTRSPKFATRGYDGERVTLELELKLLADVGLVGMPNAGKSTLLRALTGGRARTAVAGYAFTTLNPSVAVIRMADDGAYEGERQGLAVYDETLVEERREQQLMDAGAYAHSQTRNRLTPVDDTTAFVPDDSQSLGAGHAFDADERFRFTIADNPGLIECASENAGLGHSFLRSIERSLALAYVVDLSAIAPWDELRVLRDELEKYQPGMSSKARMVIANKADLLAGDDPEAVLEAREKLQRLEEYVRDNLVKGDGGDAPARTLDVVPVSAKFTQNLRKVVVLMRSYVEEARSAMAEEGSPADEPDGTLSSN